MRDKYIRAFSKLGTEINDFLEGSHMDGKLSKQLEDNMLRAFHENGWFTEDNIRLSLQGIASWLSEEKLSTWLEKYPPSEDSQRVGIIMAGNIPLVGFHDLLCVLLSGHQAMIKMSSSDKVLLPILIDRLSEIEADFSGKTSLVERLSDFDAVIATGSNNSARYFEYYFRNKPHIIRKNRNSLAILSGIESEEQLRELGKDIFCFYGLGCRNVSKVLLPEGFDLNRIFGAITEFEGVAMNKKYANNYDYYKAFYMLNKADLLENGFFLMKEDSSLYSPVAMLFYQFYSDANDLKTILEIEEENLQCLVTDIPGLPRSVPFGKSQFPTVDDYADGVDTMKFLCDL
jgi:hypothetical protein